MLSYFLKTKYFIPLYCKIKLVSKILIFGNKMVTSLFLPFINYFFRDIRLQRESHKILKEQECITKHLKEFRSFIFKLVLGINPLS